jgi:hypothetical protein
MSFTQQDIKEIASKNDLFWALCFSPMITRGVQELNDVFELIRAVSSYADFNEGCDPWGEHDFGSLEWDGTKVYWKIDYYDQALKYGGDPLSGNCKRVLTILTAEEY